jgi:hypothetical protein
MLDLLDELNKVYQEEIKHDKALYIAISGNSSKNQPPTRRRWHLPKKNWLHQYNQLLDENAKQQEAKVQRNQDIRKFFQNHTLDTTPTASGNQEPAPLAPVHSQMPYAFGVWL